MKLEDPVRGKSQQAEAPSHVRSIEPRLGRGQ